MNLKENFINNATNIKNWANANSAAILLGTGLFAFGVSLYSMYHDAPKAKKALEELKAERDTKEELPSKPAMIFEDACTVLKYTWKDFALAGIGAGCCIGSYVKHEKQLAAAVAWGTMNMEQLKITKKKIKEELGEKTANDISQKVTEERVNTDSEQAKEIVITKPGEFLFKDGHTGRYFACSKDDILHAENELNRRVFIEMFVSLNDFYDELGLAHVKLGDEIGWTTEIPPRFTMEFAELAEDGRPCCLLDYDIELRSTRW